jgi:hypothetical protein
MSYRVVPATEILSPENWNRSLAANLRLSEVLDPLDLASACPEFFHDGLLLAWELVRKAWGKPIKINSGARSPGKQNALLEAGFRAAEFSPHVVRFERLPSGEIIIYRPCLAFDLGTKSADESRLLAECIRQTVPMARIFWRRYLPSTFVHFDVAPLLRYFPERCLAPGEKALPAAWLQPGIGDS